MCSARVVLPEDSGPKISTIRPLGTPPMPRARSRAREPVGMDSAAVFRVSPRRMMDPLPKVFSIFCTAVSSACFFPEAGTAAGVGTVLLSFFTAIVRSPSVFRIPRTPPGPSFCRDSIRLIVRKYVH